jgi:transposase-like protein
MLESVSFEALLAGTAKLSPEQREQLRLALDAGASDADAFLAALDGRIGPERRCPHCQSVGAQKRGKANGLMRYRCTACGKSFNALTGSRLARLRKRDQWLSDARSLLRGETLLDAADACGVHVETAHRWRHRFLGTAARKARRVKLGGVVESDDAVMRHSEKGNRDLEREGRKRGGAQEPGGKDHVHVLVSYSRDGEVLFHVFRQMNTGGVRYSLSHNLRAGTILVSDAAKCFSSAAKKMGIAHVKLNISAGQRTRGHFHIQNVNNIHSRLRGFLASYRGVATKYLASYLEWFRVIEMKKVNTALDLLTTIFGGVRLFNA